MDGGSKRTVLLLRCRNILEGSKRTVPLLPAKVGDVNWNTKIIIRL
jgi:hypothetical protein